MAQNKQDDSTGLWGPSPLLAIFIRTITSEEIFSFLNQTVNCFCFPWYPKGISGGIFLWFMEQFPVDWGKSFGNF